VRLRAEKGTRESFGKKAGGLEREEESPANSTGKLRKKISGERGRMILERQKRRVRILIHDRKDEKDGCTWQLFFRHPGAEGKRIYHMINSGVEV